MSRVSTSSLTSHCFYVGNCIGARNIKFFVLFLAFGLLKTAFGFLASVFAFGHSVLFYQLYLNRRFCLSFPLFLLVLKGLLMAHHRTKGQYDLPLGAGAITAALVFALAVCDFGSDFSGNTIVLMFGVVLYAGPMVFFYLHLRSALFLVYHKVWSLDDAQGVPQG